MITTTIKHMTPAIWLNISHCATLRAHEYGAEAMILDQKSEELWQANENPKIIGKVVQKSKYAGLRYWREIAAAHRISGMPWPEAEKLGGG